MQRLLREEQEETLKLTLPRRDTFFSKVTRYDNLNWLATLLWATKMSTIVEKWEKNNRAANE